MNIGTYIAAGIAFILAAIILYAFVDRICTCIERRRFIDRLIQDDDLNTALEKLNTIIRFTEDKE